MAKVTHTAKTLAKPQESTNTPAVNLIVISVLSAALLILLVIKWKAALRLAKALLGVVGKFIGSVLMGGICGTVAAAVPYYIFKLIIGENILKVPIPVPLLCEGEWSVSLVLALGVWWFCALVGLAGGLIAVLEPNRGKVAPRMKPPEHVRGRLLISYESAREKAAELLGQAARFVFFGFLRLPEETVRTHFSITGASSSGKTLLIRLLMQSTLPEIAKDRDNRAIVYDAKQDIVSILSGMGVSCPIKILNPFDKRSVSWDMAKDITAPATAHQIASILIPEVKSETQPFFSDAARDLLTGVFVSLINSSQNWTFKDVLLATRSEAALRAVLSRCVHTRSLPDQYLAEERTAQNIFSTLSSKLKRYEFIAAAWERASERLSLQDFLNSEMILVLGNDETTRSALDAINQLIFKRLSELILGQSESNTRRTWLFLDEIREAGRLEGLSRLLTKGRTKGACVILGFQDIEGLRDVYGREVADELVGQCANKAILRVGSPETAKWASSLFGEREVLELRGSTSESESSGESRPQGSGNSGSVSTGRSTNTTTSEQLVKREAILPSEFLDLPFPGPKGFFGYFLIPAVGAYKAHMNFDWLKGELLPPGGEPNFIGRDVSDQYLEGTAVEPTPTAKEGPTVAESPTGSLKGIGQ